MPHTFFGYAFLDTSALLLFGTDTLFSLLPHISVGAMGCLLRLLKSTTDTFVFTLGLSDIGSSNSCRLISPGLLSTRLTHLPNFFYFWDSS